MKNYSLSVWCCPTDRLSESWKIGVLRGSKVSKASTESKQIAQVNFAIFLLEAHALLSSKYPKLKRLS
jgi:hypothetical protein